MAYIARFSNSTRRVWITNPFGDPLAETIAPPELRIDKFARKYISERGFTPAQDKWAHVSKNGKTTSMMLIVPKTRSSPK